MEMERDFMGLSSKDSIFMAKEEVANDGSKDSGYFKGLGAQWPFSNKVSALPHLMSFKVGQDDKVRKTMADSMSSGFGTLPTTIDAFDQNQRRTMLEFQKSFNQDRQGGSPQFPFTTYPLQHDMYSMHRSHDVKMFSVPNQATSVSLGNPYLKDHFAVAATAANVKQPLLGGIPVATAQHYILPTTCSIAGITEQPWNNVKAAVGSSAQLTIFYGGSVNVYEDISPEKAQAIMFLAGSSSCLSSNASNLKAQIVSPSSKLGAFDGLPLPMNQPNMNTPNAALSRSLSVSSHTGIPSGSGSSSNDELMSVKAVVSKVDPPKIMNATRSVGATAIMPSAIPQARKASLARFLEKRKERMLNAIPYNFCKNSSECTATESNGANFSTSTAIESFH
jgi:jasmonate ZIM domain-containing protein